jgi:hypothetical protein
MGVLMRTFGILWRFAVLVAGCWSVLGFLGYAPRNLSKESWEILYPGSAAISLGLAWFWQSWDRQHRAEPYARNQFKTLALVSLAVGAIYAGFILAVIFPRDRYGDFFDTATHAPHFGPILLVFFIMLAQASFVVFALGTVIGWAVRRWWLRPQP